MSPSQLLKPNVNIKMQKIQQELEQEKGLGGTMKQRADLPTDLLMAKQFSFSPGLQADDAAGKGDGAHSRLRKTSGAAIGSRKYAPSPPVDAEMDDFGPTLTPLYN